MSLSLPTWGLIAGVFVTAVLLLYRAALPKPIPGIPYDRASASNIFGDAPEVMKFHAETGEVLAMLRKKCKDLDSPIIQMFMRPFGKPWVVMTDGHEAHDIMTRRTKDFDRSRMFADMLVSLYPNTHIIMKTNDQWRWNRRLVADAMTPDFLNNVSTHMVYHQTQVMMELWRQKARLSEGHTIDVASDVIRCTVDAMFAATFGRGLGENENQSGFLATVDRVELPSTENCIAQLPESGVSVTWSAFLEVFKSSELAVSSPLGRTAHWLAVNFRPSLRRSIKIREQIVMQQVKQAWETFGKGNESSSDTKIKCIVDLLVAKEAKLAAKEGRAPDTESKYLVDELSGFIVAGFDTTAATLSWGFKYLTQYQDVQTKVREELRRTFREAYEAGRQPSAVEFTKTKLPYLDAFSEEVLRHCGVVPANVRETTQDAVVLGHVIPKGVDVYMLTTGPSMMEPAMPVDDNKRSITSRESKSSTKSWDQTIDKDQFKPERWLTTGKSGEVDFDPRAASMQTFGAGLRGCFGKKLAYQELRLVYAMSIWNFDFRPIPPSLDDRKATDILTHAPRSVRVSLIEAIKGT